MTITVKPIVPTQQASNTDKVADNNTPEVPFGHVLAKEVAQHQPASKPNDTKESTDKPGKTAADTADNTINQQQGIAQLPGEMLAMMGGGIPQPAAPTLASITPTTASVDKAGMPKLSDISNKTHFTDTLNRPANGLDRTLPQAGKDTLAALADLPGDASSTKVTSKPDTPNFADLLKTTESTKERLPVTQTELPTIPQLQTAPVSLAVSNPGMIMTDKISARVGTPAWDQSLGQKIVWMSNNTQQTASLTLNPPDLGPLQIVLSVNNDQANATFISAQPDVRLAIEAAMPKLREMMSDAGIQLGQTNVSSGNTPQQRDGQSDGSANRNQQLGTIDGDISINTTSRTTNITTGLGLVNTFA
jgi:flagellar hook-length control protein FliK